MSLSSLFTNMPANDAERVGEVAPVAELPTRHGLFRIDVFTEPTTGLDHVALVWGDVFGQERVATRPSGDAGRGAHSARHRARPAQSRLP